MIFATRAGGNGSGERAGMLFLMAAPKVGTVRGIWELFHMSHMYLCACVRSEYSPDTISGFSSNSGRVFSAALGGQRVQNHDHLVSVWH